jgi:hypothetical protein
LGNRAGDVLRTAFRVLAGARGAPVLHPRGVWFEGTLTGSADDFPLPSEPTAVTGRISKSAGTPGALPDVLGLAVRIPRPDRPWDLTLSSSGANRVTRLLPLPSRHWTAARYGTIMPYRWHGRLRWLCAVAAPGQPPIPSSLRDLADVLRTRPLEFTLRTSSPDGWQDVGRLTARTAVDPQDQISFDPALNRPADLEPVPAALNRARQRAYEGSRRGRHENRRADRSATSRT